MGSYENFADSYDSLMKEDFDYEKIVDYIENLFSECEISPELVCDLACGTGNITIPMAKRGYDMIGVDKSVRMLDIARQKANDDNLDILFLNQSITKLDLYGTCDAFLCMVDGINYVLGYKQLTEMFKRIKMCFLNPEGVFIFDISSFYKLSETIGNNTFIHDGDDMFYTWENKFYEDKKLSSMYLNFFVKKKKGYKRFCERHIQRAYTVDEIKNALKKAGFADVKCYDNLTFDEPKKDSQRIIFLAR